MSVDVVVAGLAFLGAGVGSALGYLATARSASVERKAREREEWGRRFTTALAAVTGADQRQVAAGSALLVELVNSTLASEDDRRQAFSVMESIANRTGRGDLRLIVDRGRLVDIDVVGETGDEEDQT